MKTIEKSSAAVLEPKSTIHPAKPASTFGAGFRQFLMSMPSDDDSIEDQFSPVKQPLRFLEAVPPLGAYSPVEASPPSAVQHKLSSSLAAALIQMTRPVAAPAAIAAVLGAC